MKKTALLLIIVLIATMYMPLVKANENTIISVENAETISETSVRVPVKITNNSGICGITVTISYDSRLSLTGIERGSALSSLNMTKPGDFSESSVNVVFDGMEEDKSDGILFYLVFTVPEKDGIYNIELFVDDAVNSSFIPVNLYLINGKIVFNQNTSDEEKDENVPEFIKNNVIVGMRSISSKPGESIEIPLYIKNNSGICGMTISVHYDSKLTLTAVEKGEALENLVLTKPGNLSLNPAKLVFDGMEEDKTEGIFAILTFTAPESGGEYYISISYDEGDIVDGNLEPINVKTENGKIFAGSTEMTVKAGEKSIKMYSQKSMGGSVFIVFYDGEDNICAVKRKSAKTSLETDYVNDAKRAKIMWWTSELEAMSATGYIEY